MTTTWLGLSSYSNRGSFVWEGQNEKISAKLNREAPLILPDTTPTLRKINSFEIYDSTSWLLLDQ